MIEKPEPPKPQLGGPLLGYLEEHGSEPYVWGGVGPAGFDASRFLEPTDWNAWIKRDRWGATRALLGIELRHRLRLLRSRVERRFVNLISRRR